MAIPTLAEATAAASNKAIAGIEQKLTVRLESPGVVAVMNDPANAGKPQTFEFVGESLSTTGVELLKASITKSGWTSVSVENTQGPAYNGIGHQPRPTSNPVLVVKFAPPSA